jgi:Family of unknown function (DUF5989)
MLALARLATKWGDRWIIVGWIAWSSEIVSSQKLRKMMRLIEGLTNRAAIAGELLSFLWHHKWWWLTPMILVLPLVGGLVIVAQSSAIAPFIYTLF